MDFSPAALAMGKLALIFAVLILLLRRHVPLWLTIFAGCLVAALISGISPAVWPSLLLGVPRQQGFLILCLMIFLILVLSGVQEATGQNHRLVEGLERYIHSPRIRLVLFPALIGLLPMPGGALFSCPMIRDAARKMNLSAKKKTLINYWFRHIWELAWPLYPGYALVCSLLSIPISTLWKYSFPLVFLSFAAGWFFFLRDLDRSLEAPNSKGAEETGQTPDTGACACSGADASAPDSRTPSGAGPEAVQRDESLFMVLAHALPLIVTLGGAALFGLIFDRFLPEAPGQLVFSLSLALAIATALYQGRGHRTKSLRSIAFGRNTGRIMLLLFAIYTFKDTIAEGGIVAALSGLGDSTPMVLLTFLIVPFISGLLTGILVGLVGLAFPILLGVLAHSHLQEYTTPLVVLGLIAGNCGQLLSPLHVCLVVTCEFFTTALPGIMRSLFAPTVCYCVCGILWVCVLAAMGASF